jgi:hypothetical protein
LDSRRDSDLSQVCHLGAFVKFMTMMPQFMSNFLYSHLTVTGLSFALVLIFSARNVLEIKDA